MLAELQGFSNYRSWWPASSHCTHKCRQSKTQARQATRQGQVVSSWIRMLQFMFGPNVVCSFSCLLYVSSQYHNHTNENECYTHILTLETVLYSSYSLLTGARYQSSFQSCGCIITTGWCRWCLGSAGHWNIGWIEHLMLLRRFSPRTFYFQYFLL